MRRRPDVGPETEPDWIDAPEDFEPLPAAGSEGETPSAWRERETKRARGRRGTERDWIDPPEAFGPLSADDTEAGTSGLTSAPTEAETTGSEPDRVVGQTDTQPAATIEAKSDLPTQGSDDKAKIAGGDRQPPTEIADEERKSPTDDVQRDISARFAEAFLAELGSEQAPHVDAESAAPLEATSLPLGKRQSTKRSPVGLRPASHEPRT